MDCTKPENKEIDKGVSVYPTIIMVRHGEAQKRYEGVQPIEKLEKDIDVVYTPFVRA